jgi:hypothetical protein
LFSHPQKIEKYFKSNLIVRDENNIEYSGNHLSISVDLGSSISISQRIEKKNVKTISSFFVYQNSEEWKEIQATENEIFCQGKLSNTIPMVKIFKFKKKEVETFESKIELYFFVPGIYNVYSRNSDENKKNLSIPDTLLVEVKNK